MTETIKKQSGATEHEGHRTALLCTYSKYTEQAKKYTTPLSFREWEKSLNNVVETC